MALSPVEICNNALIRVGADRIDDLGESNKRARLCNERYDKKRKALIQAHPWNFASIRVALVADVATPEFDFDTQYTLPADNLRVLRTNLLPDSNWVVEGKKLLCNSSDLKILYLSNITDTSLFPAYFDEALAADIAKDIAYALTQSNTRASELKKDYEIEIRNARSFDAQEGSVMMVQAFDWVDARFSTSRFSDT